MRKVFYMSLFVLFVSGNVQGQAFQLSQFYATPTFLNPAFTGSGVCARLNMAYRVQWPSIPGAFKTSVIAFDHAITKKNSGLGFLFVNDKAGSAGLRSTSFSAQYSYQLTISRNWAANLGAEGGYVLRDYDFSKFLFGDQIAYGTATSVDQPNTTRVHYFDFASGAVFFTQKAWIGFAVHHLNQPNQAVISSESKLPVLFSVQGGTKFALKKEKGEYGYEHAKQFITPVINYRAEKKFDQLDAGCYYTYLPLSLGIWYRGIPLLKAYKKGYPNNDALVFLAGLIIDRMKFAYSYDYTISWLYGNTAGSHEITVSYQFCDPNKRKDIRTKPIVPCPKF
ncbi:MAG: type IX secretion system membrane protein PorP/SprF [Bacteroidetes bacterium]|nr:type IX secretion system membrane protein PorP/SprF [Bacteroidota bacterium]